MTRLLALSLTAVVIADQALKGLVMATLAGGRAFSLGPLGRIRPVRSATLAGRVGLHVPVLLGLWSVVFVAAVLAGPSSGLFETSLSRVALGSALGGAASNLVDVAVRRGVVDLIDLRFWPAFNLADVAIVLGVPLAFLAG